MEVTMLGTGNAFSTQYFNNNALIQLHSFRLLIDCGITLPYALHKYGYNFNQLDGVLITHIHADHVGGLETYALKMMYQYNRKPNLYIADSLIEPLWEYSLKGSLSQGELTHLSDFFHIVSLKPHETYELAAGLTVKLIRTNHIPKKDSFSILFNNHFFYSGDMTFDSNLLLELVEQGVDIIYHDCQLESPGVVHTSLEELLSLPAHIQQKIKLMHYSDSIGNYIGKTGLMDIVEQGKPSII